MFNNSIICLPTSSDSSILAPRDAKTDKPLVFPTANSIIVPNHPDYMVKNGKTRIATNHYGTQEISTFSGTPDELVRAIGADFKAVPTAHYYMGTDGVMVEAADRILVNSKTHEQIGKNTISNSYQVFDFDEGIYYFFALLEEIKSHGYNVEPAVAKIYGGSARMFLQYRVFGGEIMGEPVDTYLTLLTSHDKSSGFTICLSMVRLFCQNQINRMLKSATNQITLRHSRSNKERIEKEASRIISMTEKKYEALNDYLSSLATIKVNNSMIFDAMAQTKGLANLDTQTKINKFTHTMEQLMACYNMPDLNDWRDTALGAYYAFTDYVDHVEPNRATKDETYLERSVNGNPDIEEFIDTLVKIAE